MNILNVAKTADEFLNKLKNEGFNKIKVARITRESIWNPHYAIFLCEFYIPVILKDSRSKYCIPEEFDYEKFNDDFETLLQKTFPGCSVRANNTIHEFEIEGPRSEQFFEKYREELEELSMEKSNWFIFDPTEIKRERTTNKT
jgi:hypothetical protein